MSSDSPGDYWDFYSCEIDGKPHSTMVNLSYLDVAPVAALSLFCCIEVQLQHPHPEHGMTTNEEFQPLSDLEDFIGQKQSGNLKYVARQTGDRKRKFYFYGSSQTDFASLFDSVDQAFEDYEKSTFSFEDPDWKTYFEDLYPNALGLNEIANRSVFLQLEEAGDDLNIPRTIDHSVVFQQRNHVKEFERVVMKKGFTVEIKTRGVWKKTFNLLVQRTDPPSELNPITYDLQQLAEGYGGSYDGWGCEVETPSN